MTPTNTNDTRPVQLHLPPATADQLAKKAKQARLSLEAYLEVLAEKAATGGGEPTALDLSVKRMATRTPEQIMADRERVLRTARPGRPLPEGMTLFDVVEGTWPGDETDEEIRV